MESHVWASPPSEAGKHCSIVIVQKLHRAPAPQQGLIEAKAFPLVLKQSSQSVEIICQENSTLTVFFLTAFFPFHCAGDRLPPRLACLLKNPLEIKRKFTQVLVRAHALGQSKGQMCTLSLLGLHFQPIFERREKESGRRRGRGGGREGGKEREGGRETGERGFKMIFKVIAIKMQILKWSWERPQLAFS